MLARLYQLGSLKRAVIIWVGFMAILWSVFGLAKLVSAHAFSLIEREPSGDSLTGIRLFAYIILMNGLVLLLIAGGNVFVRFGWVTPGLIVLLWQGVQVGWIAGSNSLEVPFPTLAAANLAFLRVGLWEMSAYALICAVTLPKSLLVSATFPARSWVETRQLRDLRFDRAEVMVTVLALVMWLGAAIAETVSLS